MPERPTIGRLDFVGAAGARLAATVRRPAGIVRGSVLLAHCFTYSKDLHTLSRLARRLAETGWVSFAFDFTGLGESGGAFEHTTVSTNVGDLRRAATTMIEQGIGPCVLIGHSLGGVAVVLAAADLHSVDAVACLASPADADHVRALLPADLDPTADEPAEVCVGGRPFRLDPAFVRDLDRHDVTAAAAALDRPFLVVEAGADTVVGHDQTRRLAEAGRGELVTVPGADHLFTAPDHARQMSDIVVEWASRNTSR